MANYHNTTTWAQVIDRAGKGHYFHSRPLRIRGEQLSGVLGTERTAETYLYGNRKNRDTFNREIIADAKDRDTRYMAPDFKSRRDIQHPTDITYFIARDGVAMVRVRRNGAVEVNAEQLAKEDKRLSSVVWKLEPVLLDLFKSRPDHWLINVTD